MPKLGGDLSVILDLGTDLFAVSALVIRFGILLRLAFWVQLRSFSGDGQREHSQTNTEEKRMSEERQ